MAKLAAAVPAPKPGVSLEDTRARAADLRTRAKYYEKTSWWFLMAMLAALFAGGWFFYYLPTWLVDQDRQIIAKETRLARLEALKAGQQNLIDIVLGPQREQAKASTLPYLVEAKPTENNNNSLPAINITVAFFF